MQKYGLVWEGALAEGLVMQGRMQGPSAAIDEGLQV